jgi:pyrroline-5-carboxylate reductase
VLFNKKIAFIGAGNMGEALLGGLLTAKLTDPANIIATDIRPERLQDLQNKWKIRTSLDNRQAAQDADVILLCVKPQTISEVLAQLKGIIRGEQLVISILAGITTDTITYALTGKNPVVRAMPNIPAVVQTAATAICMGKFAQEEHRLIATRIFQSIGQVEVVAETQMDVVTGLSGSGPSYIYMIIEALSDGGVLMGLPRDVATRLASQTVLGSARLVQETRIHPAVLRDQVTTPGGTAIAAIKELEASGLRPMLIRAVETATRRSKELSELLKQENGLE